MSKAEARTEQDSTITKLLSWSNFPLSLNSFNLTQSQDEQNEGARISSLSDCGTITLTGGWQHGLHPGHLPQLTCHALILKKGESWDVISTLVSMYALCRFLGLLLPYTPSTHQPRSWRCQQSCSQTSKAWCLQPAPTLQQCLVPNHFGPQISDQA